MPMIDMPDSRIERIFDPKNAQLNQRKEYLSPSRKYRLTIIPFATKEGCWNYIQGVVYRDSQEIAEVQRNYSHFPYVFVENHPNGHDYLICGEDYQGQTVIELDTGKRIDHVPDAAKQGFGYCWVEPKFYPEAQIVVAAGCVWACPYEYRFYDFSAPMEGWPELEVEEYNIESTGRWPEINGDIVKCFLPDEDDEDILAAVLTLRRKGFKLVKIDEWLSDEERQRRINREEADRKYTGWLKEFKTTDPLYLVKEERISNTVADEHISVGITYGGWCPDFFKEERRICQRIVKTKSIVIDLEWGAIEGPIKLVIFRNGKHVEDRFFRHSAQAMHEAFDYTERIIPPET